MAVKQKKRKVKKTLTGKLGKLAALIASAYLVVSFISGQVQVAAMQKKLEESTKELEQQQVQNQELQHLVDSGDEDAYVERIAREMFGYARPNERVFVDISGQ